MNLMRWIKKTVLIGSVAALTLAAAPWTSVQAAAGQDPSAPPAGGEVRDGHLERAWARLQIAYDRQGRMLDRADRLIEKAQSLLDRAEENGKDVAALQAALDAFADAVKDAHPIYESAKGIINSHKGFDDEGKVTDSELAAQTVEEMAGKLQEIRELVGTPGKALREALKAFRESNRPAEAPAREDD